VHNQIVMALARRSIVGIGRMPAAFVPSVVTWSLRAPAGSVIQTLPSLPT